MNIGHNYSVGLKEGHPTFNRISKLPVKILDWIEDNRKEGIILWDKNEKICFSSKSVEKILGFSQEDLFGKGWNILFPSDKSDEIRRHLNKVDHEPKEFRMKVYDKNNQEKFIEFLFQKIITENDNIQETYYMSSLRDVTEYEITQEIMVQAEKMSIVGQLGASIAHEIRNPLTSIKGFLQLLQAGVQYKDEYYEIMAEEIEKMEAITSELLSVARPLTNKMKLLSVDKLVRDVVTLLQSQAMLKNITLHIEQPISEVIYCNSSQIKQVLINLIKNAIEAMDEPGVIKVYVRSSGSKISIYIEDEGKGIPPELVNNLNVPFFTTKEDGTGLGLIISRDILKHHEGTLKYKENEGTGSTFIISFPKIY